VRGVRRRAGALLAAARRRSPALDHALRTYARYQADGGDTLAASVTYFGFLSFFPLVALAFFVTGVVVRVDPGASQSVSDALSSALPGLIGEGPHQLSVAGLSSGGARATSGVIGVVGLLVAGLGWLDALRDAIRTLWHHGKLRSNPVVQKLTDVLQLLGLGAVLAASLGVTGLAAGFAGHVLGWLGIASSAPAQAVVFVLGLLLPALVDVAVFWYVLARLPRVEVELPHALRASVVGAVGFEILKTVGGWYLARTTGNALYGTFAVVVGLLIWINLTSRLTLYVAAYAVTAPGSSDTPPSGTAGLGAVVGGAVQLPEPAAGPGGPPVPVTAGPAGERRARRAGRATLTVVGGTAAVAALLGARTVRAVLRGR
jgi:membrane protein